MKSFPHFLVVALAAAVIVSLPPRDAVAADDAPRDARSVELKDLDGYFPWTPSPTAETWAQRAEQVRMQMRVALGLWPEPTRTPLNAVIHGRIERDDYAVEKVYFEAMPGFYVTGSLFRPRHVSGKVPAVLCPHGHWDEARFALRGEKEMKKELESGGERFASGGRSMFQSLGVQLARMGCVAFVIDMIGYCDSQQLSFQLAHKFAKQRAEMISPVPGEWGFYSPQAESHAQSILGLQTWMNIRALDFLTSLPDVDATRLACTGASGGGTQTMLLGALDPRLAVAAPCVMVSTAMQGGCTCENASGLRVGTGNIEFAALFAPKPMGMSSAKDWTIEMPTKGFPELQKHWAMLGAPDAVKLWHHPEFGHNYNLVSREHIYAFFNEHLRLGLPAERLRERDYEPLTREQLTVWNAEHPQPPGGPDFEKKLLKWWHDDAQAQMTKDMKTIRRIAEPGMRALFRVTKLDLHKGRVSGGSKMILFETDGVEFGAYSLEASDDASPLGVPLWVATRNARTAVLLSARGKAGLTTDESVTPQAMTLLKSGWGVVTVDLAMQGERIPNGASEGPTPTVKNPRQAAAYTFGYNDSLAVQRVKEILTTINCARAYSGRMNGVALIATDSTAPLAVAAAALAGEAVDALIVDTGGFRFQNVRDIRDPMFFPGVAKYGDLPGLLALGAPRKLFLMGEGATPPDLVTAAYETAGAPDTLRLSEKRDIDAAVQWLIDTLK